MDIRILGPLEVLEDGRALELGGTKQRAVLAVLALHANRVVSLDQLVAALWEDDPPDSARKALQVYISQLRKVVGRERLQTKGGGYVLRAGPDELDLARFERLRDGGEIDRALSLWRGTPLGDLVDHRFAQAESARLEELRLACIEQRIGRDLAEGRHAEVVGELEGLVHAFPHREHLHAELMLALYRSGRQAEALEAYQAARDALVSDLGLEPGRELRDLHQQILTQDSSLDQPVRRRSEVTGTAVAAPHSDSMPMRKTVTVLFCDLAGSTELGERLDPEALRTVMTRWYDAMRIPLERAGGTVEKFVGDAVMAVFGVPSTHEDDAFRAVQAAIDMREAAAALELPVRIGVNTGEVMTGDSVTTLATGDAINTAKRLEEAAAPGEILIGAATRLLVANATELEPAVAVSAKGKSATVHAWRVLSTIPGATPFARRLDVRLVGRGNELVLLRSELATAVRGKECRVVTIHGSAGIGKSRLAEELLADAGRRVQILRARCVPYGDGITFLPLRELFADVDAEHVFAASSNEEIFLAVRRVFEGLAGERPLLVCLEDVHWAQPAFLDLVEYLAGWSHDAPILLLCLARPELYDERPRWPGVAVRLDALSDTEASDLLDALATEWPLTPEARAQIGDVAEGNPLFLEQLVAMLAEGGAAAAMPPTIHALLTARLDRLEPGEQTVLQRAAVAGREFSRSAVADLSPVDERGDVGATLLSLVRKELVRPAPSDDPDEDGFRFRHALIRDAAYAEIPKRTRAELHERFATWLEVRDAPPELVGYHLEQAYRCGVELGLLDGELGARAGALLADAGERAFARDDGPAAANLLLRASDLLPPDDARQLRILRRGGLALWWTGDIDEARLVLTAQIERAAELGNASEEWSGRLDLAAFDLSTGRIDADQLLAVAEDAITAFDPEDGAGLARAWRRVAHAQLVKGRYALAVEASERALVHSHTSDERFEEVRIVDLLCTSLLYGPADASAAAARCEQMLRDARGNELMEASISAALAGLHAMCADLGAARACAQRAAGVYLDHGLTLAFAGLTQVSGPMELLGGDPTAAERELRRGLEVLGPSGSDGYQQALLAEALYQQGRLEEAAECARAAAERSPPDLVLAQVAWRAVRAKLERSEALAQAAVALAETTDAINLIADALTDLAVVMDSSTDPIRRAADLYERKGNVAAFRRLSKLFPAAVRSLDRS